MRLGAYVLLMFSFAAVFYYLGYKPVGITVLQNIFDNQGGNSFDPVTFVSLLAQGSLVPQNAIALLGIGVVATLAVSLVTGFAAVYIIPIAILIMVMNLLIFPFSFILDPAMPEILKLPVVVLMQTLMILSVLSFIRGGNV